jgi:hypothetical protein
MHGLNNSPIDYYRFIPSRDCEIIPNHFKKPKYVACGELCEPQHSSGYGVPMVRFAPQRHPATVIFTVPSPPKNRQHKKSCPGR